MIKKINRRDFMATSLTLAGTMLVVPSFAKNKFADSYTIPKREFGNSGVKISKLCLGGGSFGKNENYGLIDEALKYGLDCWESGSFTGKLYGEYFKKHPELREKIFLTGKVYSTDPTVMEQQLQKALSDNGTSYIDFLAVHVLDNVAKLNNDVRKWVEKVKKEKKVKFFGFCTHKNMYNTLSAGAELGWLDGIQTVYNYRTQNIPAMQDGLQKCHEKGIGIFAVKTMGLTVQKKSELQKLPLNEEKINSILSAEKMSFEQVKLRAVWQEPCLTSIASLMPTAEILHENIAAAIDEGPLSEETKKMLLEYAESTDKYFCRRCGNCDNASTDKIPIFDIMELLMYSRGYPGMEWVTKNFMKIPPEIRNKINTSDYSLAEKNCPQKMPIGQLMKEAYIEFNKEK